MPTYSNKWGFLRESQEAALKAGIDKRTGLCRTGVDEYLKVIFPSTSDWVHDETTGIVEKSGKRSLKRPDWRSATLKLIIEFDGVDHYKTPHQIISDSERVEFYEKNGYKVVRIPYFIQLTNDAVEKMFGVSVEEKLFDETIPALGEDRASPACLCPMGIQRMAREFHEFPTQYKINIKHLESYNNEDLTGCKLLKKEYDKIK